MLVFFSARHLKPGSWEQFRRAWDPGGEKPPGLDRVIHARNIRDEDEVISFGIFDMSPQDYHDWRASVGDAELQRVDAISAFVKNVGTEGVYEVIEVLED